MERQSFLTGAVSWLVLALVVLLPIFIIPSAASTISFSKALIIGILVLIAFIVWLLRVLRDGFIEIPLVWIFVAALAVLAVYAISSLMADVPTLALISRGFETGTFFSILTVLLPVFLIPTVVRKEREIFRLHFAFLAVLFVVAIFQLVRLFGGVDLLSFNVLTNAATNIVGRWNDLGVYFGLGALLSAISLEFLNPQRNYKIVLYVILLTSLFFVALVNFTTLWYVLGIFGVILLIYRLSLGQGTPMSSSADPMVEASMPRSRRQVSIIGIVFIVLAAIFIFSGGDLGNRLSAAFGVTQLEVRPSWSATFSLADATLTDDSILGTGPNRFTPAWLTHKPDGVNETPFWAIDFTSGVGFIPSTLITVGIVGFAAWIVFLGLFVYRGVRSIFMSSESPLTKYLTISSFIAALYLWVFAVVYIPNAVLLELAGIFTGLFIASAVSQGVVSTKHIDFASRPAWNFVVVLITVALVIASGVGLYTFGKRMSAHLVHEQALQDFGETGDIDAAKVKVERAIALHEFDRYYRSLTDIELGRVRNIVQGATSVGSAELTEFQTALGSAIASARRATELDPVNYQNWVSLGTVYAAVLPLQIEGAYDNARAAYDRAVEVAPHNPALYLTLARLEAATGNGDATREYIRQALEEKTNYLDAVFLLAQLEVSEGNIAQAVRTTEAGALLAPNDPLVFFQLGLLYYNMNRFNDAILAFERAVSLTPVYANARYFLGLSYDQVGRREDAIAQFEQVRETNPENGEVALILENLRAGNAPFADAEPPIDDAPEDRETPPLTEE